MRHHEPPPQLTYDFIADIKGNNHKGDTYYNTKLTITGEWARTTKHSTLQKLSGVKSPRPRKNIDRTAYIEKLKKHPEEYVEYLFTKWEKIGQSKRRSTTRAVDLARTNHKKPATKSQFGTQFLLFTYANEPSGRREAWRDLQHAMDKYYKVTGFRIKALATLEEGEENGRLHFHVIAFNVLKCTYEWWQDNVWTNGWVGRTDVTDITGVAKYITKTALYITKDENYVKGQRRYSSTRHLEQPTEVYERHIQIPYLFKLVQSGYGIITNDKWYRHNDIDQTKYALLTPSPT
jgi:hypothetical protein